MNNTGNRTESFTEYMYNSQASKIPGTADEKSLKMYMRERVFNDDVDPLNLKVHEGPTVVLVKTAHWTTTTRSAWTTATQRPSRFDSDSDSDPRLSGGKIAGIVVGVIGALFFLITCCCYNCCCGTKREPKPKINPEEQARIVAQGVELMEQGKRVQPQVQSVTPTLNVGNRATDVEIERMRDARAPEYTAEPPPPRYTP
jgi:hypothetical protein